MDHKSSMSILVAAAVSAVFAASGCSSSVQGTYSDPMGAVVLELKSGSSANITFAGQVADCTYSSSSKTIKLTCKGDTDPTILTIHDDGSLTGPPGSFMPMLRKHK
jgi:VCBS repeat-containing protein